MGKLLFRPMLLLLLLLLLLPNGSHYLNAIRGFVINPTLPISAGNAIKIKIKLKMKMRTFFGGFVLFCFVVFALKSHTRSPADGNQCRSIIYVSALVHIRHSISLERKGNITGEKSYGYLPHTSLPIKQIIFEIAHSTFAGRRKGQT
jgi:hypothetical protein